MVPFSNGELGAKFNQIKPLEQEFVVGLSVVGLAGRNRDIIPKQKKK